MKTTREKRLDNIYSSNINEGFYQNAGGNFEVELVKKLLDKSGECFSAEKSNTSGVGKFTEENVLSIRSFNYNEWVKKFFSEFQPSDFKNGFPQGFAKYYFDNVVLYFSPETIRDEREIPKYFSLKKPISLKIEVLIKKYAPTTVPVSKTPCWFINFDLEFCSLYNRSMPAI